LGIDVEYHTATSYEGFICLVQVSYYDAEAPYTYIFNMLSPSVKS